MTDDFIVTKPLRKQSDAADALIEIINALKATNNQYTVKNIQAVWEGEFRNNEVLEELQQRGTTLKETVPRHNIIKQILLQKGQIGQSSPWVEQ